MITQKTSVPWSFLTQRRWNVGTRGLSLGVAGGRRWRWSGAEIHIVLKKLVIKRCIYLESMSQEDPKLWWTMHGPRSLTITQAIHLLSQVSSSSAAERNWSTYSFIHSLKRNRLTSRRAEKLVVVHSALHLIDRNTTTYKESPTAKWDVEPE